MASRNGTPTASRRSARRPGASSSTSALASDAPSPWQTCSTLAPRWTRTRSGDVRELAERGVRAVLATPIVAQERLLGVLAFHRAVVGEWSPTELALAEAVAREAASRSTRPGCCGRATGGWPSSRRCSRQARR